MDPIVIYALIGGVVLVVGLTFALTRGGKNASDRLRPASGEDATGDAQAQLISKSKQAELSKAFAERILRPLSHFAPGQGNSRSLERLVHAGIRRKGAAEVLLGAKIALAIALPAAVLGGLLWFSSQRGEPLNPKNTLLYCSGAFILGIILPNLWLSAKVRARQEEVRFTLPDALDLLVVCIESGLALDAALVRIGREMRQTAPALSEELQLLNLEVSAGKPREECLRNFGLRTGVDEAKALAARIIQTAKFGTNLAQSLRVHAESLRQKRRQEAEERAAKTTVKFIFPLVFFIFPAIFVVILGPAVVQASARFFGE